MTFKNGFTIVEMINTIKIMKYFNMIIAIIVSCFIYCSCTSEENESLESIDYDMQGLVYRSSCGVIATAYLIETKTNINSYEVVVRDYYGQPIGAGHLIQIEENENITEYGYSDTGELLFKYNYNDDGLNSIEVYDENIQNIKLNAMYGYRIRGEKYIDCVKRKTEVLLEEFEDSHSKFQEIVLGDFAAGVAAYCAILGCTEYEDQVI